jgi:NADH-quinone oxidoreductase subunit N
MGSLIAGSLGALGQKKLKGFIAYTSINQMGFPLIALSVNKKECLFSSFFFLILYILITSFFFYLLFKIKNSSVTKYYTKEKAIIFLNQLRYLRFNKGLYIFSLLVVFFSMAGIPPLAGFFGKYLILFTLISSGLYFICFFVILISIVSAFYYLKVLKVIFFDSSFTKKELNNKIGIYTRSESSIYLCYLFFICFFLCFFNDFSFFIHDLVFIIKVPFSFFLL